MYVSNLVRAALVAAIVAAVPAAGSAQVTVGVGVTIAPPAIPVYVQPLAPAPNYMWQPGYWAWGPGGYFWVPGTWVVAPAVGLLWTPGFWGWNNGAFFWHRGYWGPTVGFYGGINYGFGYFGSGFVGGRWDGPVFRYNTAIMRVNTTVIHNTFHDTTVVVHNNNRTGFNGGHGGIQAHPTQEQIASREHGEGMTSAQTYHRQVASEDRNHLYTVNNGHPNTAAVSRPFSSTNRPEHSAPITNSDKQAAQRHVAPPQGQHNNNNNSHNNKPPR
jgi:hypothetical protein